MGIQVEPHKINILLANIESLTVEIITEAIKKQADMKVVGVVTENIQMLISAGWDVDIVILGDENVGILPAIGKHILSHFPHIRILVTTPSGDNASLYWMSPSHVQINPLSEGVLIETIRKAYWIASI